jgi:hypothetical protein
MNFTRPRSPRTTALSCGIALAAAIALAAPATAQFRALGGLGQLNQHDYLHRDMVFFAQELDLDDGQRVILDSLYEDYRDNFEQGFQALNAGFMAIREMPPEEMADQQQALHRVLSSIDGWRHERDEIRERFEENVKAIINAEQLRRWPALERRITREKTMHHGRLSGESLNLYLIVRDLRLDERTAMTMEPTIEQYGMALDAALQRRNQALWESQADILELARGVAPERSLRQTEREVQARLAVRDVNDHYIELIADVLPSAHREPFRETAKERAYPRVFRPLPAQRLFHEAKRIEGLEPETVMAIEDLERRFLADLAAINTDILQLVRGHEPEQIRHQARAAAARQAGENIQRLTDPSVERIRERDERATYYVELLRELLTPEQFGALPGAARYTGDGRRADVPAERRAITTMPHRSTRGADGSPGGAPVHGDDPARNVGDQAPDSRPRW